jgi:transposase
MITLLTRRTKSIESLVVPSFSAAIEQPLAPWMHLGGGEDDGTVRYALDQLRRWDLEIARLDQAIAAAVVPADITRLRGERVAAIRARDGWQAKRSSAR